MVNSTKRIVNFLQCKNKKWKHTYCKKCATSFFSGATHLLKNVTSIFIYVTPLPLLLHTQTMDIIFVLSKKMQKINLDIRHFSLTSCIILKVSFKFCNLRNPLEYYCYSLYKDKSKTSCLHVPAYVFQKSFLCDFVGENSFEKNAPTTFLI